MKLQALACLLCLVPSLLAQDSRPSRRPTYPEADAVGARTRRPDWGSDAPGRKVVPVKLLPITRVPYARPDHMRHPVRGDDLVIGLARGREARAYPVKMLGGPSREIINDRFADEPYVVNW